MPFITTEYPIKQFNGFDSFPTEGELLTFYVDTVRYKAYLWDASTTSYKFHAALNPDEITSSDQANELERGILEIATQAETNAGTDDTRAITPKKLAGFLSSGFVIPFVPEKTIIPPSNAGAWVVRALGVAYANKLIQIRISKTNNNLAVCGARETGSILDLSFALGRGNSYFEVLADPAGSIEIRSNRLNARFWITGTK
jgi:hypothetical protein